MAKTTTLKNVTLENLLHALNITGVGMDIYVEGEEEGIWAEPPVQLTPEGRKYFEEALAAKVEVTYSEDCHQDTYVSDPDDDVNSAAWELLSALAGYCNSSKSDKWFTGETAEII